MNKINIFVRSRGVELSKGYTWLNVGKEDQSKINGLPDLFRAESTSLIYSENPTVVISRRQKQLLLLLTAFRPSNRVDRDRRQIRISIAWIGDDSLENESAFRSLAARALDDNKRDELTQEIAEAISSEGEYGFEADYERLLDLSLSCQHNGPVDRQPLPDQEATFNKLAKASPKLKQLLVQTLTKYQLPKRAGVLVVSTSNKTEGVLRQAEVWRGLSSLVKSPEWTAYYPFPEPLPIQDSGLLGLQINLLKMLRKIDQFTDDWLVSNIELTVNQKLKNTESD